MGYFAQPSETIAGLVLEVCPGGEGCRLESFKPEGARDEAVSEGEEHFAPGPQYFAVSGPDAHLSVQAVGLAVL